MEKAMYPSKNIRITQKDHVGTHAACFAVDEASIDGGISNLVAPFTGTIKKIYTADANEVWLESIEPVEYADSTIDYMTIMFCHANDVSNLFVGKKINQGEEFYSEGTKGNATGNHVHFECGKGKFTGTGWYKDSAGHWSIINGKKVDECLFIDDSYNLINTAGYDFKKVMSRIGTPVERNEEINQVKVFDTTTILRARNTPNGEVLGYMNSGIYNLLERKADGDYEWFRVEDNLWFAYSNDWCEYLPKKEIVVVEENSNSIEQLQRELAEKNEIINNLTVRTTELTNTIIDKEKEISALKEHLANVPKLIFESPKLDYYAIKLPENQKLYLGK